MSLAYGWTPTQIGELTLAQIFTYWMEAKDPGDGVNLKPAELGALQAKIKYQRDEWESQLWCEVNCG